MVYVPSADVIALRCCPVSRFTTATCAVASGLPSAALTRPWRVSVFWASRPAAPAESQPAVSRVAQSPRAHAADIGLPSDRGNRGIWPDAFTSALAIPRELHDRGPAGPQLQCHGYDARGERAERAATGLVNLLDLAAA